MCVDSRTRCPHAVERSAPCNGQQPGLHRARVALARGAAGQLAVGAPGAVELAAQLTPETAPVRSAAVSTMAPRFIESPPVIQGFAGTTGVLISFGDGGQVRAYRLNDVLTPGENITAISPSTGEITTTRRTIRK